MQIVPAPLLVCPHDGGLLGDRGNSIVCASGHSFDRARQGYVNLLPVQDKASRDPGDSKEMVAARRRFLETGAYAPIAQAVADLTLDAIAARNIERPFVILDAGCGEGYYLQLLEAMLGAHAAPRTVHLAGIDISKWAVRAAAKRDVPVTWAVASNRRPPFPPASVDLILCLFGFPVWAGFASVQPPQGCVMLVDPCSDHLIELREIIYPVVRRHEATVIAASDGYRALGERRVKASATLASQGVIADLLAMTPHGHRASAEGRAALAERDRLSITIDVMVRVFGRDAA